MNNVLVLDYGLVKEDMERSLFTPEDGKKIFVAKLSLPSRI